MVDILSDVRRSFLVGVHLEDEAQFADLAMVVFQLSRLPRHARHIFPVSICEVFCSRYCNAYLNYIFGDPLAR